MRNRNFMPRLVASVFFCLVVSLGRDAFGVVPVPDGGYPGANTAEGQDALFSLTTGVDNTAVGWLSLRTSTEGKFNTALGAGTLYSDIGNPSTGEGILNTAIGAGALLFNTSGGQNTATGAFALFSNTGGTQGTLTDANTADGFDALFNNIEYSLNTAMGAAALFNIASFPTAGPLPGGNTAIGAGVLFTYSQGIYSNTAIGLNALPNLNGNFPGGGPDIGIGVEAGSNLALIENNRICIGAPGEFGGSDKYRCYIGNIWNQAGGSQAVYVNEDGKLGFEASSRRFNDEIKPMGRASEIIYKLKPVGFRYRKEIEPGGPLAFGLIAEDVEKLSPDLVTRGSDGRVDSVRYDAVNAMLLNEFLNEHNKVERQQAKIQEQQATIAVLGSVVARRRREIDTFTARFKKQAAQIEKVSAEIKGQQGCNAEAGPLIQPR